MPWASINLPIRWQYRLSRQMDRDAERRLQNAPNLAATRRVARAFLASGTIEHDNSHADSRATLLPIDDTKTRSDAPFHSHFVVTTMYSTGMRLVTHRRVVCSNSPGDRVHDRQRATQDPFSRTRQRRHRLPLTAMHDTEIANVTEADIYVRLTKVFQDVFADDDLEVQPKMTAGDVPEWDSMSHVRLMLTVERAFNAKFAAAEIAGLQNVGDLVSVIKRHCAA
jgi:acyl carrier protein